MEWAHIIDQSVEYIESHILEDMSIEDIAKNVGLSSFFFQKGFAMFSGYNVGEYIRNRRLSLAGNELLNSDCKVIDVALTKSRKNSPTSRSEHVAYGLNVSIIERVSRG